MKKNKTIELKTEATEASLSALAYGELHAKFDTLGIPEVWSGGVKKAELIRRALIALDKIKDKKLSEMTTEETDRAIEKLEKETNRLGMRVKEASDSVTNSIIPKGEISSLDESSEGSMEGLEAASGEILKKGQKPVFAKNKKGIAKYAKNQFESEKLTTSVLAPSIKETNSLNTNVLTPNDSKNTNLKNTNLKNTNMKKAIEETVKENKDEKSEVLITSNLQKEVIPTPSITEIKELKKQAEYVGELKKEALKKVDPITATDLKTPKFSKKIIEENLLNIDRNLSLNIPTQRNILLKKKAELLEMMKYYLS